MTAIINNIGLAFLDMDGTLNEGETLWEILHKANNTWESHGMKYLDQYLKGHIGFEEFACLDVACWTGHSKDWLDLYLDNFILNPKAIQLLETLKEKEVKTYILTNGIGQLAEHLTKKYDLEDYFANPLEIVDDKLTGKIEIQVGYQDKGAFVRRLRNQTEHQGLKALAIGDSSNDLPMFEEVEYPILLKDNSDTLDDYQGFQASGWAQVLDYIL